MHIKGTAFRQVHRCNYLKNSGPLGPVVKEEEEVAPPMPPGAFFKEEGVVPPMPLDAVVKAEEHEVVVKGEERSHGRPKRQRNE